MGNAGHTSRDDGRVLAKVGEHEVLEPGDMDLLSRAWDGNCRAALRALWRPGGGALHGAGRGLNHVAANHLVRVCCCGVARMGLYLITADDGFVERIWLDLNVFFL